MAKAKELEATEDNKVDLFDLGSCETTTKSNEGIWIPIINPVTEEETDTEFLVRGFDSDIYIAWRDAQSKATQKAFYAAMASNKKNKDLPESTALDGPAADIDLLMKLVVDWKNVRWCGEQMEFNPANLKMVLTKNVMVRNQLKRAADDRERFFQTPSTNS